MNPASPIELERADEALNLGIDPRLDRALMFARGSDRDVATVGALVEIAPSGADAQPLASLEGFLSEVAGAQEAADSRMKLVHGLRFLTSDNGVAVPLGNPKSLLDVVLQLRQADKSSVPAELRDLEQAKVFFLEIELALPGSAEGRAGFKEFIHYAWKTHAVRHIQLASGLRPQILYGRPSVNAEAPGAESLQSGAAAGGGELDGQGVIVGIVDYGLDFANPNFREAGGERGTRLLYLWDQNGRPEDGAPGRSPSILCGNQEYPFRYGVEYTREQINDALLRAAANGGDAYRELNYDPHANYYTDKVGPGAHGTFVADIAAGNGTACFASERQPGLAPAADLIFVQVRITETEGGGRTLCADDVLDGVRYIFERAGDRPAVVNLSLNTNGGPHDGHSYFARQLDFMLEAREDAPGRAVVIAAGNFRNRNMHLRGTLNGAGPAVLRWNFQAEDLSRNDVEIWYHAHAGRLSVTLVDEAGNRYGPVNPEELWTIRRGGRFAGTVVGSRYHPADADPRLAPDDDGGSTSGRQAILLSMLPNGAAETWSVELDWAAEDEVPGRTGTGLRRLGAARRLRGEASVHPGHGSRGCGRGGGLRAVHPGRAVLRREADRGRRLFRHRRLQHRVHRQRRRSDPARRPGSRISRRPGKASARFARS